MADDDNKMDTDMVSRKHSHPLTDTEDEQRKSKYTDVAVNAPTTSTDTTNTTPVGPSPDGNKDTPPVDNPPAGTTATTPVGIPPVGGQIPSYADLVRQNIVVATPYYVGKATITAYQTLKTIFLSIIVN